MAVDVLGLVLSFEIILRLTAKSTNTSVSNVAGTSFRSSDAGIMLVSIDSSESSFSPNSNAEFRSSFETFQNFTLTTAFRWSKSLSTLLLIKSFYYMHVFC